MRLAKLTTHPTQPLRFRGKYFDRVQALEKHNYQFCKKKRNGLRFRQFAMVALHFFYWYCIKIIISKREFKSGSCNVILTHNDGHFELLQDATGEKRKA